MSVDNGRYLLTIWLTSTGHNMYSYLDLIKVYNVNVLLNLVPIGT